MLDSARRATEINALSFCALLLKVFSLDFTLRNLTIASLMPVRFAPYTFNAMAKKIVHNPINAQKEAEVETFYANVFREVSDDAKQHHLGIDILTHNFIVEVKHRRNIDKDWAEILAQALYYQNMLHTLGERVRPYLAVVDEDEVSIFESEELRFIWANEPLFSLVKAEVKRASDAHQSKTLMNAIQSREITCWDSDVPKGIKLLQEFEQLNKPKQRPIQLNNVIEAFDDWGKIVRDYLKNNNVENAFIFYEDATGKGIVSSSKELEGVRLTIVFENYGARINRIPEGQYRKFEKRWKRLDANSREAEDIRRRLYELCEMDKRRSTGSFYTPYKLAKLAWEQFKSTLTCENAFLRSTMKTIRLRR